MAPDTDFSFVLVALAPFIAAALAPAVHRFVGHLAGWVLAIVPASVFIFLLQFANQIRDHHDVAVSFDWIPAYSISFSFYLDGLSLAFGLLISGIGTIIVIYSGAYLKGHVHQGRFFSFILMFMGSMLGIVMADNLIVLFVFWELTSITSFLLIGFDHSRQAARRAAIQALVVTGGGGLVLLAGIGLLHLLTIQISGGLGTWSISDLRGAGSIVRDSSVYLPILLMFLVGAFTKSAQFPFHFWLPNAMEAPTPVSAFLHSATMVKAGVYLLARMNPVLGGTAEWQILLTVFGGITLLWGGTLALRQTDLKQMLAQTTVASLGLLVLLIGVGTEAAIAGAIVYLLAHAFYKAALFLAAGSVDHGTGTRDITELAGLGRALPLTFAGAVLAAVSMAGLPLTLGFLAKEEMYADLATDQWQNLIVLIVVFAGNALMGAVAFAVAIRPFFGVRKPTPLVPHEGSVALWGGPILLGVMAVVMAILAGDLGAYYLVPVASPVYNFEVENHLSLIPDFTHPAVYLSVLTWAAAAALAWRLFEVREGLKRWLARVGVTADIIFDAFMHGVILSADAITRLLHHGRLEYYLLVVFCLFALAIFGPLLASGASLAGVQFAALNFYEFGVAAIAAIGVVTVLAARTRLIAILSLGIQGFAVALLFMLFGAPDLSFTQFMVEILSVVILALVMTRLHLDTNDSRIAKEAIRDGAVALVCGASVSFLLLVVLQTPLDPSLTDLFAATSVPLAHGHNIVNVILVDYRGLDTLGEITVVMTAGIAIFALIRMRGGGLQIGIGAPKRKPRRRQKRKAQSS